MGATPVPIPNTMVKTQAADGTALETVWESRWLPNLSKKNWSLPVIRDLKEFKFLMTGKQSIKYDAKLKNLQFFRSWHYMPIHEKAIMLRQASLSHTIVFHVLASLCTLKTAYKYMIRNIKTSEVIVITINLNTFEENELKQLTYYQRM